MEFFVYLSFLILDFLGFFLWGEEIQNDVEMEWNDVQMIVLSFQ